MVMNLMTHLKVSCIFIYHVTNISKTGISIIITWFSNTNLQGELKLEGNDHNRILSRQS